MPVQTSLGEPGFVQPLAQSLTQPQEAQATAAVTNPSMGGSSMTQTSSEGPTVSQHGLVPSRSLGRGKPHSEIAAAHATSQEVLQVQNDRRSTLSLRLNCVPLLYTCHMSRPVDGHSGRS